MKDFVKCTTWRLTIKNTVPVSESGPQAALWAEISKHNPDFISYDNTAKLAYLLHPTELIFIKGFISFTCTGTPFYIIHIDIFSYHTFLHPLSFLLLLLFCCCCCCFFCCLLVFVCWVFLAVYFILSSMPYFCPVHVMLFSTTPPPPPPSTSTLHLHSPSSPHAYAHAMHTQALHTHTQL